MLHVATFIGVVALASLSVVADITEEDGVLVLNEGNFDAAIKNNAFILVEFYAPWCGHCKQFAPEYAAAARHLKTVAPPVPLAKVDATAEHKLAEEHGVRGYPTLRLFIDGKDQEYTGGRTEQSIVTWVQKKTGMPARELPTITDAHDFEREHKVVVIGLFDEGHSRAAFESVARTVEDVMFGYSTAAPVMAKYNTQAPAVKMFFPHDEQAATYEGDATDVTQLERFVKSYRHPLVVRFDGDTAPEIFGDGRPVLFLFRDNDDKGKAAEQEFRKAAIAMGRQLMVSVAGSSEPMDQRLMDYVSVEPEELPTVRLLTNPMASMTKYRMPGTDITEASVLGFVNEFKAGKLEPHMKSETPPTSQPGPVYVLVGTTFQKTVKDPAKDVLVEFYAPWCGHCKKLEPVYKDVAKRLESVNTILIAKIDATANDVEGVDIEGFPMIKLWRANNKDAPLDYDGDRDVDGFLTWLEDKVTHPFSKDDISRAEL